MVVLHDLAPIAFNVNSSAFHIPWKILEAGCCCFPHLLFCNHRILPTTSWMANSTSRTEQRVQLQCHRPIRCQLFRWCPTCPSQSLKSWHRGIQCIPMRKIGSKNLVRLPRRQLPRRPNKTQSSCWISSRYQKRRLSFKIKWMTVALWWQTDVL